ncbi:hypothetical protein COO60DRAFT_11231 [Scenedesmus sp. NREL 46B-D3]|nr:hypothetical protein COO60DRAFT_11231 [Scenedesmus sp. NREL 46B-D3]
MPAGGRLWHTLLHACSAAPLYMLGGGCCRRGFHCILCSHGYVNAGLLVADNAASGSSPHSCSKYFRSALHLLHAAAGAGWGGCVVALVPAADAPAFMLRVRQAFYEPALAAGKLSREQLQACLFVTAPAGGAEVLLL